jgi:hypothetical protein
VTWTSESAGKGLLIVQLFVIFPFIEKEKERGRRREGGREGREQEKREGGMKRRKEGKREGRKGRSEGRGYQSIFLLF